MRTRSVAIALAATAAVALWIGMRLGGTDRVSPPRPAAPAAAAADRSAAAVPPALPRGLTRDDLRAVVREELARSAPSPAEAPSAAQPSQPALHAAAIIEDGLRDGAWSTTERAALRVELVQLSGAEIDQVLSPLFQAINAQRVRLDGPPI